MSESLRDLRSIEREELIRRHDDLAQHTTVGVSYYLEEIARRDHDDQTKAMMAYTRQMRSLTIVVTIATIVNVVILIYQVLLQSPQTGPR